MTNYVPMRVYYFLAVMVFQSCFILSIKVRQSSCLWKREQMQYLVAGDPEPSAIWTHIPLPPQQMLISTEQSSQGVEKEPSLQLSSNETIVDHTHRHIRAEGDESQVHPSGALNFPALNL